MARDIWHIYQRWMLIKLLVDGLMLLMPMAVLADSSDATAPPMTDIHDIHPPVQVGTNPWLFYGIGGALLLVLLSALLIWWFRRHGRGGRIASVDATVYETPEEEALRQLGDLEMTGGLSPVVYYFRLSGIFRHYLKRRYAISATEMTTEELLPELTNKQIAPDLYTDMKHFFQFADAVKFARHPCDETGMRDHLTLIRNMIDATTPVAQENGEED